MTRPEKGNYTKAIAEDDYVMTIEEWLDYVKSGSFIDYDGMGSPAKDGLMDRTRNEETGWPNYIYPSQGLSKVPLDATHIVWFNR